MKLCFSTYASVLIKCQAAHSTQIKLCRALLDSLHPEIEGDYSDSAISDIVHGKKNIPPSDIDIIERCDRKELSQQFNSKVVPLIDSNKRANIVLSLLSIISADQGIRNDSPVELINNISKEDLVARTAFVFSDLLAGIFIYILLYTRNTGIPQVDRNISTDFVSQYDKDDRISFIDSYEADAGNGTMMEIIWKRGVSQIDLVVGDLFQCKSRNKEILVVPVDTAFSTVVTQNIEKVNRPCVSDQTVHGKWLLRMCKEGLSLEEINQRIHSFLLQHRTQCDTNEEPKEEYPIGTIAVFDNDERVYFLLAISTFDDNNIAHGSREELGRAIDQLLKQYNDVGQGYDMYIPLLGTGRSRIGLTTSGSFEYLKSKLLEHKDLIQGRVSIVIRPEDYQMMRLEEE